MDSFLKFAFKELFADDGLIVMARGLGIDHLFSKFALYHSSLLEERKLVFCLNCSGMEEQLNYLFLSCSDHSTKNLPQVINNEVNTQERIEKYMMGGCYIITSRILIVDLLDGKVNANSINGLLIYNAHRISEMSIESFIVKVYRERNRLGFVKGFSEDPETLQSGFGKVERLMRILYVKKLYLWPRFRLEVVQALAQNKEPEVVELVTGLTSAMKSIQSAVLAAMNTCIQELKRAAPQLETSQMTLESGLFHAFDVSIKNQLESEWHRTGPRTKQLVSDLGVLRKLLDYLIRYDAFAFYYLLMKLQQSSSEQATPSMWLLSEAANVIFKKAKERVYKVVSLQATDSATESTEMKFRLAHSRQAAAHAGLASFIQACGECPPKWKLTRDVLKEIHDDYKGKSSLGSDGEAENVLDAQYFHVQSAAGRVLIIVKDSMAQSQLRDVLVKGIAHVCDQRYRWFVSQQAVEIRGKLLRQHVSRRSNGGGKRPANEVSGMLPTVNAAKSVRHEGGNAINSFLRPDGRLLNISQETTSLGLDPSNTTCTTQQSVEVKLGIPDSLFQTLPAESKMILVEEWCLRSLNIADWNEQIILDRYSKAHSSCQESTPAETSSEGFSSGDKDKEAVLLEPGLSITIMTHSDIKENYSSLHDFCPAYVLLHDPDISIIRSIETYQSQLRAEAPAVKVYFIFYEGSGEEHRYAGALFKEKKAFESLISAKENMVISLPDHPEDVEQQSQTDKTLLSMDTRSIYRGSTSLLNRNKRDIIVDVRDFRCTLPSMLHGSGQFSVVPRTLTVGDYVLSPEICVERKGISDLFQSFASGRLYNQVEAMFKHYKLSCLLIEFSHDKAFSLQAANELSPDILQHAISSRIVLLALSFPSLRILWSRSAANSVDIFRSLVSNHEEVDVNKAVAAGSLQFQAADAYSDANNDCTASAGADLATVATSMSLEDARSSAREVLLSLPGINVHNFRVVMGAVTNLAELSAMSEEQLCALIGQVNAKKLYTFFGQSI